MSAALLGCGEDSTNCADDTSACTSGSATDEGSTSEAATSGATSESATTAAGCGSALVTVHVVNDTSWTLAALEYAACGGSELDTYPFPGGGLEAGASIDVPLPYSGCVLLNVNEPSGCELDPLVSTGALEDCATFELALDDDMFICPGG